MAKAESLFLASGAGAKAGGEAGEPGTRPPRGWGARRLPSHPSNAIFPQPAGGVAQA